MIIQAMPYPAAPSAPALDYFANNGATAPIYGNTASPAAIYVSSTDTTWFAWEGIWNGRAVFVRTYNHTTETWTDPVVVSTNTLNGDDHGVPVLCRDADGHVHCFYGSHNSSQRHSYTTNADDPSAWTAASTLSGDYSYPKPVLIGSTLYLFLRDGNAGAVAAKLSVIPSTSISSGAVTWGSKVTLATPETDLRIYTGAPVVVGTQVHIPASIADASDSFRRHVYYLIYETADGSLKNHDASVSTASGSLPIGKSTMDTSYRVIDQGTDDGNVPALCIDANGDPHLAYLQGSGSSFTLYSIVRQSGSWSSPSARDTVDDRYSSSVLIPHADGSIDLYYDGDAGSWSRGGNIERQTRSSGGTWGSSSTILSASDYALTQCCAVFNGHADARAMFAERRSSGVGELRVYAYGASGFLTQPEAYETETETLIAAFSSPPSQRRKELIDASIRVLKDGGAWTKLDAMHVFAAADSQAALINWKAPGTYNASLVNSPTFTADRGYATNGTNSYVDSNFNPATAGGNFSQNSAMFAIFPRTTSQTGSVAGWYDGTDGITIRAKNPSNNAACRINHASEFSGSNAATMDLVAANRSGASAAQIYVAGSSSGTSSGASTALNSNNFYYGRFAASSYAAFSFGGGAMGGSMTAGEHSALRTAFINYMLAVGAT